MQYRSHVEAAAATVYVEASSKRLASARNLCRAAGGLDSHSVGFFCRAAARFGAENQLGMAGRRPLRANHIGEDLALQALLALILQRNDEADPLAVGLIVAARADTVVDRVGFGFGKRIGLRIGLPARIFSGANGHAGAEQNGENSEPQRWYESHHRAARLLDATIQMRLDRHADDTTRMVFAKPDVGAALNHAAKRRPST